MSVDIPFFLIITHLVIFIIFSCFSFPLPSFTLLLPLSSISSHYMRPSVLLEALLLFVSDIGLLVLDLAIVLHMIRIHACLLCVLIIPSILLTLWLPLSLLCVFLIASFASICPYDCRPSPLLVLRTDLFPLTGYLWLTSLPYIGPYDCIFPLPWSLWLISFPYFGP